MKFTAYQKWGHTFLLFTIYHLEKNFPPKSLCPIVVVYTYRNQIYSVRLQ
jgi:hypothetical protein